jgi:AraC-like DNA-binding protein
MNPPPTLFPEFLPTLDAVGIVACLLVILIMLFRQSYRVKGGGLLLFCFLVVLYPLLVVRLYNTGFIHTYPHLLRTSPPVGMLYIPAMYLYLRTLATRQTLRWLDALHLLPTLLFVVDFLPFYTLPADAKRQLVLGNGYWKQLLRFDEGWLLPPYWHHYIRSAQVVVYWVLDARIVLGLLRHADFLASNRAWFTWMLTLLVLQLFPFIPAAGGTLLGWNPATIKFWFDLSLTLMVLLTCFTLMLRPEILYGLRNPAVPPSQGLSPEAQVSDRGDSAERLGNYIPPSLIDLYDRRITEFMQAHEAFLKPGYTLREMAENTDIPLHHLSAVINRRYGYHFNEYINHWRVEHLKQRLDKNEWKSKTLKALARESGFNNRTTFITAFKKHCGVTPSDYIRGMKDAV